MNPIAKFWRAVRGLPPPVQVWLAVLVVANGVVPLFFFGRAEARVVFATWLMSAALMVAMTHVMGFTRLLGLAHLPWLLLLVYLWARMGGHPAAQAYGAWIRTVMVLNLASLIMDAVDVVRYVKGDRTVGGEV